MHRYINEFQCHILNITIRHTQFQCSIDVTLPDKTMYTLLLLSHTQNLHNKIRLHTFNYVYSHIYLFYLICRIDVTWNCVLIQYCTASKTWFWTIWRQLNVWYVSSAMSQDVKERWVGPRGSWWVWIGTLSHLGGGLGALQILLEWTLER